MFGFSGGEILLIALIALILFGNDKLPDNMKKMIKGLNQAKKVAKDVQVSWQDVKTDVQRSINFDEEKEEVRALVESATIHYDEESENGNFYSIPTNLAVPQQEIDDYQDHFSIQKEQDSIIKTSNEENQKYAIRKKEYLSPHDFLMSPDFIGPRI